MRFLCLLLVPLVLSACSAAIHSTPTSEAEKVAQAEELVQHSLSNRLLANLRQQLQDQLGSMPVAENLSPQDAERIVNEELDAVISAEEQRLLDSLVPVYRRYYTAAEISELLSFYQTDVARKSQKVSSQIAGEVQQSVRLWNEHFEETLLDRIQERMAEAS